MSEAAVRKYSVKAVFLKICQNSQENTCTRVSFLIKLQARPTTLLKKSLWHMCFPVNFEKFLRTTFLQNTSGQLLLELTVNRGGNPTAVLVISLVPKSIFIL